MRSRRIKSNARKLPATTRLLPQNAHDRQSTRLRLGNYVADIVPGQYDSGIVYQWIVQRAGSSQILSQGQEATLAEALACGHRWLERLARKHKGRAAIYESRPIAS